MKEYLAELEEDFERLYENSMAWDFATWAEQAEEGRFKLKATDWKYSHIYWYDNYVSVIAAKAILKEMGEDFKIMPDEYTEDWAIITTYKSNTWKGL